ncbi:MAG TPA: ATP-binding protein [Verrucomicrobiae bacterium]|nr:ATP-binding protein [Verrucomicrobiae bacterium]
MKLIVEYLNGRSRTTLVLMGLVLVIYIGELDYVTGPMVALMVFYLIPVCFVAWFAGRWPGIIIAVVGCGIWYGAKYLDPGSIDKHLLLLWNTLQRLALYTSLSVLTTEVAERKRVEQALRAAQEGLEIRVRERTQELARANDALHAEVLERTQAQANLRVLNETLEQRVAERSAAAEERARELARSEAALRQQTSILQSILNSMGDGVIVADARGKILLFNPAAERLIRAGLGSVRTGDSPDRFKTYLSDTLTVYPTNQHPLIRAMRGEVIDGAEIFLRQSDSSEGIWLAATGRPLIDEHGQIQGGVVVYTDMSARKQMEKQVAEISDREQRRIGQDLHDSLCQHLVSIAFAAELMRDKLERYKLPEAAQAETIAEMVNEGISQARNLARGLYPVRLEVDGLASALEELTAIVQARNNVACHFSCEERVMIYDEVAGNNLFRIVQESINNAVKHGHCKNISIGLGAVDEEVILTIKDDGVGFPAELDPSLGMGLSIMNYRAKMIGASLDIRRGAGGGTIVLCSFHNENFMAKDESKPTPANICKPESV